MLNTDRASTRPSTWVTVTHARTFVCLAARRLWLATERGVEHVIEASVARGQDGRPAVETMPKVADEPGVEHGMEIGRAMRACSGTGAGACGRRPIARHPQRSGSVLTWCDSST